MGTWALNIQKRVEQAKADCHQLTRSVVAGVVMAVDRRSPVGDRELWAINQVNLMNREMYQLDLEAQGKRRVSRRTLERTFGTLQPKGYIGGRFRANWQLGVDHVPAGELFQRSPPATSYPTDIAQQNINAIPRDAAGRVYYLTNNLPYAQRLEDGWSTQAPTGMVEHTRAEWQAIVNASLASLRGGAPA